MFCEKCGTELEKEAIFCPKCGQKIAKQQLEPAEKEAVKIREDDMQTKEKLKKEDQGKKTNESSKNVIRDIRMAAENKAFRKIAIIGMIITFIIGGVASGLVTYYAAAKPVLDMKNEYELKIDEAQAELEKAQEKYKEINNIKVSTSKPEKTQLQGKSVVGSDIAPGTYKIYAKDGHVRVEVFEEDGLKDYEYRAYYYGEKEEIGTVVLKAGEVMKIEGEGIAVFTPEKEGE